MNMIGAPKHAVKALEAGVDIVCAQGGEGGGHTGDIPNSILIPAVADVARKYKPRLLGGGEALVVAAGGIYNGRGLASSLMQGASGVWVGTRFVASEEAGCSRAHKEEVVSARFEDTLRTLVVSGRPLRVKMNDVSFHFLFRISLELLRIFALTCFTNIPPKYIQAWENQPAKIQELTQKGITPLEYDLEQGKDVDIPHLMGVVAGVIEDIKPAGVIVDEMVSEAVGMLKKADGFLSSAAKSKL